MRVLRNRYREGSEVPVKQSQAKNMLAKLEQAIW